MLPSQPHSLFVRDRTQVSESAGTSIEHLRGEMQFLRESKEYRIAIEKELEVWVDMLMESEAVDRKTLKRAVSQVVDLKPSAELIRLIAEPLPYSLRLRSSRTRAPSSDDVLVSSVQLIIEASIHRTEPLYLSVDWGGLHVANIAEPRSDQAGGGKQGRRILHKRLSDT